MPADSVLFLLLEIAFSQTSASSTACRQQIAQMVGLYSLKQSILLNFIFFPPRIHLVCAKEDIGFDDFTGAPVPW